MRSRDGIRVQKGHRLRGVAKGRERHSTNVGDGFGPRSRCGEAPDRCCADGWKVMPLAHRKKALACRKVIDSEESAMQLQGQPREKLALRRRQGRVCERDFDEKELCCHENML